MDIPASVSISMRLPLLFPRVVEDTIPSSYHRLRAEIRCRTQYKTVWTTTTPTVTLTTTEASVTGVTESTTVLVREVGVDPVLTFRAQVVLDFVAEQVIIHSSCGHCS